MLLILIFLKSVYLYIINRPYQMIQSVALYLYSNTKKNKKVKNSNTKSLNHFILEYTYILTPILTYYKPKSAQCEIITIHLKPLSNFYKFVEFLTFPFTLHTLDNSGVVAHIHRDK